MPDRQWHPLFVTPLREALSEARPGQVGIQAETALSFKPLFVDVLVVKKHPTVQLTHPMASIFRRYNVFEFKSPEDYLAANDYYIGMAKTLLYKALEHKGMLNLNEFTLTFVASKGYPRSFLKMIRLREDLHLEENSPVPGIYQIYGETLPVQVVVLDGFNKAEYAYMFAPFLSRGNSLRLSATTLLWAKRRNDPDNVNVHELVEFNLRNNLMTREEMEVIAQMIAQMSTAERAQVREILEDTLLGREIIEKGKIQGKQEDIKEFLHRRFGAESPEILMEVQQLNDLDVLHDVLRDVFASTSLEEARAIVAEGITKVKSKS